MKSIRAQVVRVRIEEDKSGLFYASSPELKGLLVAKPTIEALEKDIPRAIAELFAVDGWDVLVSKMEDGDGDLHPWVAFPASIAKECLARARA